MPDNRRPRLAYAFFKEHYESRHPFTSSQLENATGWAPSSVRTYISKKWRDVLDEIGPQQYRVKLEFSRMSEEQFLAHFSQRTPIFGQYRRVKFDSVVTYEFLLPLAREGELRAILEQLFYADTIRNRLEEIGVSVIESWVLREPRESDDAFLGRVTVEVGDMFGGYSVQHVEGRFRGNVLQTHAEAAELLARYERYLIDETTASVRFIIPMLSSRTMSFDAMGDTPSDEDFLRVRKMFLALFAEALVRTVKEEDEIWLLEESENGRSLFVWERAGSALDQT